METVKSNARETVTALVGLCSPVREDVPITLDALQPEPL